MTFVSFASGAWYLPDLDVDEDEGPNTPMIGATSPSGGKLPQGVLHDIGASLLSRPSVEFLHDRGIMQLPAAVMAGKLERKISQRPSVVEVQEKGLLKSAVNVTRDQIHRKSIGSSIEHSLTRRASMDHGRGLHDKGIVHLSHHAAAAMLEPKLEKRPSKEELVGKGLLKSAVCATRDQIHRKSIGDSIAHSLVKRASIDHGQALHDKGIVHLSHHAVGAMLEGKLEKRPSVVEVQEQGLLKNNVSATKQRLARRSLTDALEGVLEKRPSADSLKERGIMLH